MKYKNKISCKCCNKTPKELDEYNALVERYNYKTVEEAVVKEEGTYNSRIGKFYCTDCYIKVGMPVGKA